MNLGAPVLSLRRYNVDTVAFFAWWDDESSLEKFLRQPSYRSLDEGWHVRMRLYRRWGEVSELRNATVDRACAAPEKSVVAVTLARLNLRETRRFTQWGKPVESQVRDHPGKTMALAAFRPCRTFSTFSVWETESEMLGMVAGKNRLRDGENHSLAMRERVRRDFHHEFTTMRFVPFKELGTWNGRADYTSPLSHPRS